MLHLLGILIMTSMLGAQSELRPVERLDATKAFYEKLGFVCVDSPASRPTMAATRGDVKLRFVQGSPPYPEPRGIGLVAADPEATLRVFANYAINATKHGGTRGIPISMRIEDPDKNPIWIRTQKDAERALPRSAELNPHVLAVMDTYPTGGKHRYFWPKSGTWPGNARDITYGDELIARGDPEGRCFCCGLTFEVFLAAWQRWARLEARPWRIGNRDVGGIRKLQREWFGSKDDPSCVFTAIVGNHLGTRIEDFETALPGDFVQLWRKDASGHSVIFKSWLRSGTKITGLRYWSTQKSTQGIGENEERFGPGPKDLDPNRFWLVRVGID